MVQPSRTLPSPSRSSWFALPAASFKPPSSAKDDEAIDDSSDEASENAIDLSAVMRSRAQQAPVRLAGKLVVFSHQEDVSKARKN